MLTDTHGKARPGRGAPHKHLEKYREREVALEDFYPAATCPEGPLSAPRAPALWGVGEGAVPCGPEGATDAPSGIHDALHSRTPVKLVSSRVHLTRALKVTAGRERVSHLSTRSLPHPPHIRWLNSPVHSTQEPPSAPRAGFGLPPIFIS